ncbi:MAG TPA: type II secretion system protein [Verrucomicrobiae bacterium]|nr:type II secretion system protein [Verrucomicrobiae bacterium]
MRTRQNPSRRGFLLVEMTVGMAILLIAVIPLAYGMRSETQAFRGAYQRAIAMEIVDGELEALAASGGQNLPEGPSLYPVRARSATNLPDGNFRVTKMGRRLALEWAPAEKCGVAPVRREVTLP